MNFKYKKEVSILVISFMLCLSIFTYIKVTYFRDKKLDEPITTVISYYNKEEVKEPLTVIPATTKIVSTTSAPLITTTTIEPTEVQIVNTSEYPYLEPPIFIDDGSIIYDGMTITELTNKLNRSLTSYLTNTGYFFAKYTKGTGMDPYLSVAIVLHETGCKWKCSTLTRECNNIGGLKGGNSCNGSSYRKYDTLEEGIEGYLNTIYYNYYKNGFVTPEAMASSYAASSSWPSKVRSYMNEIKAK